MAEYMPLPAQKSPPIGLGVGTVRLLIAVFFVMVGWIIRGWSDSKKRSIQPSSFSEFKRL